MTTLTQAAADAKAKMQENPGDGRERPAAERRRVPLSSPQRKLEVPPLPGYHLRWIRGTPQRLAQAEQAGFEFVTSEECKLNNASLGGDAGQDGNTDLGSRVSIIEGSEVDGAGQAVRLYLMKQRMEWYLEDQAGLQKRNDSIAEALSQSYSQGHVGGPAQGERPDDAGARYVDRNRSKIPALFRKKIR